MRLRIVNGRSWRGWTPTLQIRNPQSAIRNCICLLLLACTPITTRPDFLPDPQAPRLVLDARPERVTPEIAALVAAESLQVERVNVRDGYVETAWYDTRSHRSFRGARDVSDLAATVKIRCWADPYVPGQTRLTVEAAYRPRYDPSRPDRDLEVIVPKTHAGHAIADSLSWRRSGSALGHPAPHPPLHDVEIHHRIPAGPVGQPHREPEHRELARDVPQAGRHVALARHGHHRPRAPFADHAPRELPAGRHEYGDLVPPGDREHAVQRLLRETARDQHQQLALPHRPPTARGEGVVDVDRGVLRPVAPPENTGDVRGEAHQVQIRASLEQPPRQQQHTPIEGKQQQREPQRARARRDRQRAPQQRRQGGEQGFEPRGEQEQQQRCRTEPDDQREGAELEKQSRRCGEVAVSGEGLAIPFVPYVAQAAVGLDVDELGARRV